MQTVCCWARSTPEVGIPELQARLKAAGLEKYINAKRAALEAWAAANGIQ